MVQISHRESNWVPSAINYDCYPNHYNPATSKPYICAGLIQVMETNTQNWFLLLDPYYNVEVSYELWLASGYSAWAQ